MSLLEIESYKSTVSANGPENAEVLLLVDCPATADEISRRVLSGEMGAVYLAQFRKLGIRREQILIDSVCRRSTPGAHFFSLPEDERTFWRSDCFTRILQMSESLKIIIPAGEEALNLVTGKRTLSKWHLSPLRSTEALGSIRTIPMLSPHYIMKIFKDIIYITLGAKRVSELLKADREPVERTFIIKPTLEQVYEWKEKFLASEKEWCSIDIETSAGQITCIGFSDHPKSAICIPTLPTDWNSPEQFFAIWKMIAEVCESSKKKTGQNLMYDATYLSAYGIIIRNVAHDTMMGIRYMHPELKKGLDNNARVFLYEPYWKDEAKDWNSRQNIDELYIYNCKDTSCTNEITLNQIQEMKEDSQYENFQNLAMKLWAPCAEMSWTGFPVRKAERERLLEEATKDIKKWRALLNEGAQKFLGKEINTASHHQVKELLKAAGFRIPMKKGKESSDYESLLKLRLRAPDSKLLEALVKLSKLQKQKSSYLSYRFDEEKSRMFFSMYPASTETLRMTAGTDPWSRGINPQTVPRDGMLKGQFGYD